MTKTEIQTSINWLKELIRQMESSGVYTIDSNGMFITHSKANELLKDYEKKLEQL